MGMEHRQLRHHRDDGRSGYADRLARRPKTGSATVTATFKDIDGNPVEGISISKTYTVMPLDISKATVTVPGEYAYTGHEVEPKPLVSMSGTELIEGVDYTVTYSDNVEIGQATVTITGIGNAAGTASGTFSIGKADIFPATLSSIAPSPIPARRTSPRPPSRPRGLWRARRGHRLHLRVRRQRQRRIRQGACRRHGQLQGLVQLAPLRHHAHRCCRRND